MIKSICLFAGMVIVSFIYLNASESSSDLEWRQYAPLPPLAILEFADLISIPEERISRESGMPEKSESKVVFRGRLMQRIIKRSITTIDCVQADVGKKA